MATSKTNLAEDGSSTNLVVGASGYNIIQNKYDGIIEWSTTDISNGAWHTLVPEDTIKVDFNIFLRKTDKFSNGKLVITA